MTLVDTLPSAGLLSISPRNLIAVYKNHSAVMTSGNFTT